MGHDHTSYTKPSSRIRIQTTKKQGCTAKLMIKEITMFSDYSVSYLVLCS